MERLSFGPESRYSALEAAHHLARYRFAKDLCRHKRVLDAACGEGYGSFLMARWGAKSVDGIDISPAAIQNAASRFQRSNLRFLVGNCETLTAKVEPASYDLVVSFETLEHVEDVEAYLQSLKAVTKEGGTIVISCPNDYWLYKYGGENIYHRRRLTLQGFKELTQRVLGVAKSWHRSTLAIGYSILREGAPLPIGDASSLQELMFDYKEIDAPVFAPMQAESAPGEEDLAFYIGVWGGGDAVSSLFTGYPISMDLTRRPLFPLRGVWAVKAGPEDPDDEVISLQKRLVSLEGQMVREVRAMEAQNESFEAAERQISLLTEKLKQAAEGHETLMQLQAGLKSELESVQTQNGLLTEKLDEVARSAQDEVEALRADLERESGERRSALVRVRAVQAENELYRRAVGHRDWLLQQNEQVRLTLSADLAERDKRISELTAQLDHRDQETAQYRSRLEEFSLAVQAVPWRVVGAWRKTRRVVPRAVLRAVERTWKLK